MATDIGYSLLTAAPGLAVVGCLVVLTYGLLALDTDPAKGLEVGELLLRDERRARGDSHGPLQRVAAPLVPLALTVMGPAGRGRLQRVIDQAGRPHGLSVETLALRMAVWFVVLLPVVALLLLQGLWWAVPLPLVAVVVMPLAALARSRRQRQERLSRDLPDFLDVLAVTVTAGVSFRSALSTVAQRFGGPIAEEVGLTLQQIGNGASVRDAFVRLRERNDSPQLSTFVTAYLQSEELGTPLIQTLARIALDMRRDSAQRQRQRAARATPRVTLVTVVVLVPGSLALLVAGFLTGIDLDLSEILGPAS